MIVDNNLSTARLAERHIEEGITHVIGRWLAEREAADR